MQIRPLSSLSLKSSNFDLVMSNSNVELDFFAIAADKLSHGNNSNSNSNGKFARTSTFKGIQGAISRINPTLLRRVISHGGGGGGTAGISTGPPALSILNPNSRMASENSTGMGMGTMTIFYNGTVNVLHVNKDMAENIIKMADKESGSDRKKLLEKLDLPQARKRSLQRFMEKRKERLTSMAPYATGIEVGLVKEKGADMAFMEARNV